jgi:hypothetical protein
MIKASAAVVLVLGLWAGACQRPLGQPGGNVDGWWLAPDRNARNCDKYGSVKADSENECRLVEEFRAFVTSRQACSMDVDCVVVKVACPFGCEGVPVNSSQAVAVEEKHKQLASKYNDYCRYKCRPVRRAACRENWCVAAW